MGISSVSKEGPCDIEGQEWHARPVRSRNDLSPLAMLSALAWKWKGSNASGSRTCSLLLQGSSRSSREGEHGPHETRKSYNSCGQRKSLQGTPKRGSTKGMRRGHCTHRGRIRASRASKHGSQCVATVESRSQAASRTEAGRGDPRAGSWSQYMAARDGGISTAQSVW